MSTNSSLCQWFAFEKPLTEDAEARLVATDLCGYGRSTCTSELRQNAPEQVRAVADRARALGATMPALFVYSFVDKDAATAVRAAMDAMPSTDKTWLEASGAHGWDMIDQPAASTAVVTIVRKVS